MSDPIPAGTPPPAATYNMENPPKTKEEWTRLAETDPKTWMNLTQARMDQVVREGREWRDKYQGAENKVKNLEVEFATLKKGAQPVIPEPKEPKPFSRENLPQTDEQWDQLFIENPTTATDLRQFKNENDRAMRDNQTMAQRDFVTEQKKHRSEIQGRHKDMYVVETDAEGKPRVDAQGQAILKVNPETGEPIFNAESEKGKLWIDIFNEDPQGYQTSKRGPRLMMLEMERRLKEKGEQQIEGHGKAAEPDQRGILPGGVNPPMTAKVSFTTDEERAHAQKAVERNVYKSLEEYCSLRDNKSTGIVEENRFPKFGN